MTNFNTNMTNFSPIEPFSAIKGDESVKKIPRKYQNALATSRLTYSKYTKKLFYRVQHVLFPTYF